jgi:thioredoxin-related protein
MIKNSKKVTLLAVISTLAILALFFNSCSNENIAWQTNFDDAIAIAQQTDKSILTVFTGLSWDNKSTALKEKILDDKSFMQKASKTFVLLTIDIDRNDQTVDKEVALQNYNLAVKMGIESTPAIILLTPQGFPFMQLNPGEFTDKPEDMLSLLDTQQETVNKFEKFEKSIKTSEGIDKVTAIDAMYTALPLQYHLIMEPVIRQIPELDPQNKSGLLGKYKLQLAYSEAQTYLEKKDIDGAIACFTDLSKQEGLLSAEETQELFYTTAYYSAQYGKPNGIVLDYLQKSYDAAPNSKNADQLLKSIDQLSAANKAKSTN